MIKVRDLTIEMTNKCNLKCGYCYANSNTLGDKQLPIEQIKKAIDIVNPSGIAFTGGEPFMRYDDIIELLPYARQYIGDDFKGIRIETNATMPIDFNDFMYNGSPKGVHFNLSLDGLKDVHDAQRGEGTWDKVVDFIKESLDRGFWTTAKATFSDDLLLNDFDYMYDFAKFCAELGLPRIRIGHIKSSGRGKRTDGGDEYAESLHKMIDNVRKLDDIIQKEFNMNITDGKPYIVSAFCGQCGYNRKDLILGVDGVIRLECAFLNAPLCHYSRYTPQLHEQGLYVMKKYDMGIKNNKEYDMTGRKSVFK